MATNRIDGELPGELLRGLRESNGYMSAKRFAEAIRAGEKPLNYRGERGVTNFAKLTGWSYYKLYRLERIRRDVPPDEWKPPFTRQDLEDLVSAQWVPNGSKLYTQFVEALGWQAQLLHEHGVSLLPDDREPGPRTHSPVSREEAMAVFDAVLAQWVKQMESLGFRPEQIEEIRQRIRDNIVSMLDMLELLIKSQGTGKITPEDEVTRGVREVLPGRDVRDIPRLRTLRLVYDLTNEMVEDALWEAKAHE